jgi:hypothetical protein
MPLRKTRLLAGKLTFLKSLRTAWSPLKTTKSIIYVIPSLPFAVSGGNMAHFHFALQNYLN